MSDQFTTCEHGLRLHKCETCQFRDERDDALARIAELEAENAKLREVANALADKVDATSDCDHKRMSCAEIGCIGEQLKAMRSALAAKETK